MPDRMSENILDQVSARIRSNIGISVRTMYMPDKMLIQKTNFIKPKEIPARKGTYLFAEKYVWKISKTCCASGTTQ